LIFNTSNGENGNNEREGHNSRVIKSREVRIVKNNKPVLHAKQFVDSLHPERIRTEIFKDSKKIRKEDIK